ncbi:uncharacterized protein (DUF952 family) [Litorimonas taeanensis]|uniref:Uncharacterized protein (DUF952 family) n=1 Tax=Litorimonas taeanensis TaxID=568099 RepID=A0A420WFR4_9PROT|nr:DUF952 domain-containing protein [Litorimonas taeanensis]RKQ69813.1 uncharacterized protein (DUF952 family) [Litorimonas taeanensis]
MHQKTPIYKILSNEDWERFQKQGVYEGSVLDKSDGYIHMSAASELQGTLDKYYVESESVILLAIKTERLDEVSLKWESSRGGALFPHYYASLTLSHVQWRKLIRSDDYGSYNVQSHLGRNYDRFL